jgi:fido (protein-threonine AMPylation protein)
MRGWYLLTNPAGAGTTTLWFSNYWEFIKQYLNDRFGESDYCLSSESSLDVYAAQNIISRQLVVITKKASNQTIALPHDTSVMLYTDAKNFPELISKKEGINLIPLADAICRASPSYFQNHSLNAEICLKLVPSVSDISRVLLTLQSSAAAARVAGAYKRMGDKKSAEQVVQDMAATGQSISPQDPFSKSPLCLEGVDKLTSPYAGRIEAMWKRMRPVVLDSFPSPPEHRDTEKHSLSIIERLYSEDAYHSLSIEGYQVTEDLIRKIKEGVWNPDTEKTDLDQRNALAAKGYLGAFKSVTGSVTQVLKGANPGEVFSSHLQSWYRELFAPLVQSQLMNPTDLAGFRNNQVYISKSRHVPPPKGAVIDAMETLERLLTSEQNAAVRAVLGHFIFVFIHPFMDGNGRIGRFLMNLMLISGGYNWTVIRTSERTRYMSSLEKASTEGEIEDFCTFIASEMNYWKSEVSKMDGNNKPERNT